MKNLYPANSLSSFADFTSTLPKHPYFIRICFLLIWLLSSVPSFSQGQVYYTLSDGNATSNGDQLRRISFDGSGNVTGDALIKTGFVQVGSQIVLDAANNRIIAVDARPSQSSTSLTNAKIVAVSLGSGNAVNTLVTATPISTTSTTVTGIALDRVNNYLYYTLNDGNATSNGDQLRRISFDGSGNVTGDVLIKTGFVQVGSQIVLDAANNRIIAVDARPSQSSTSLTNAKIVAVSLGSGNAVNTLVTATPISTTSTTVTGLAVSDQDPPTVTTNAVTSFGSNSAVMGGNVTSDGNVTVTERGVVYSLTNNNPTKANSTSLAIGNGTGSFSAMVNSLTGNTTYYVRAYATNAITTSYGPVQTFKTLVPNSAPTNITLSASSVAENQPISTAVGTFSTTDPDVGQAFSYSLVSGAGSTDNASFKIVGNQLQTNATFDFETKNSYSIRVSTTDNGTPGLTFEKSFTITITNVNEFLSFTPSTSLTVCAGAPVSLTVTPTGFTPTNYTWSSNPAAFSGSGTNLTQFTQNAPSVSATTTYTLLVTASNGPSSVTASTNIVVSALPVADLTNNGPLISLQSSVTLTASGGGTYAFGAGANQISGGNTATVTTPGLYSVTVTNANGCKATATTNVTAVPDLVPILHVQPSTQYGTTNFSMVVDLFNLSPVATTGQVNIYISRDPLITVSFNGSASSLGGLTVQNSNWSFNGASNPDFYILTTNTSIEAGGMLSVGLSGVLTPGQTKGTFTVSCAVDGSSVSEVMISNNSDTDKINYFNK